MINIITIIFSTSKVNISSKARECCMRIRTRIGTVKIHRVLSLSFVFVEKEKGGVGGGA